MSVTIIGCGWLGAPLAQALKSQQMGVNGTSRSDTGVAKLERQGIDAFECQLPLTEQAQMQFNDTIVIAITPGLKRGKKDYADNILSVCDMAKKTEKRIILVSSTGVFENHIGDVDEQTAPDLSSEKATLLNQAEQHVLNASEYNAVLRLSGLIGEDRHPGNFLRKAQTISATQAINLIHQQDAIGLLLKLIESPKLGGIFHGVSHCHLSKYEFYKMAAQSIGRQFNALPNNDDGKNRIVMDAITRDRLNYSYQVDDLVHWINN
ncbi:Rossmann-fold NAD(P)-binding domain-containing protein [Thalassotalea agarivorans]|uniref:hypothetical protein n=1 Tax=Thalassotalea agarivorans TaxID=349064 RepID=UPI00115FAA26|nr:hypothetical protein [Thalassotalea agarivorans]